MTQEEKDLILKYLDLCARVPYDVKVQYMNNIFVVDYISSYKEVKLDVPDNYTVGISEVKPYLFPLSSMTDEQRKEFDTTLKYLSAEEIYFWTLDTYDWCNKNHFDYRGLIEKGLSIDCTNLNIY